MDRCLNCGKPRGTGPCSCRALQSASWPPASPPDPKDATIAGLRDAFAIQKEATACALSAGRDLLAERDRLRTEVDDARQNAARTCDLLRDERDAARSECERLKRVCDERQASRMSAWKERDAARAELTTQAAELTTLRAERAAAARMREALQWIAMYDTPGPIDSTARGSRTRLFERAATEVLAETDAGALPAREESGGNDAQAGEILPNGKAAEESRPSAPSVVHLSPPGWFVRGFDAWVCGAPAYSHEEGTVEIRGVTCPECLRRGGETPGGSDG